MTRGERSRPSFAPPPSAVAPHSRSRSAIEWSRSPIACSCSAPNETSEIGAPKAPSRGLAESHQCRAAAAAVFWSVGEVRDQRVAGEQRLHDRALHTNPPSVDQADLDKAPRVGLGEIFLDDGGDVRRAERVEIECVLDRDADRIVGIVRGLDGGATSGGRRRGAATSAENSRDPPPRACTVRTSRRARRTERPPCPRSPPARSRRPSA